MGPTVTDAPTVKRQMYRRIVGNSAVLTIGTGLAALLTMLAVALAARALDPRAFGILVLLQSSTLMVRGAMSFSTAQPVIDLGAKAQAAEDNRRLGEIVSMALLVDLAASVTAFLIAAALIAFLQGMIGLDDGNVGAAWVFAGSLLFTGYFTSNGIFRLFDRFRLLSILQVLAAGIFLGSSAILYMMEAGLLGFVWAGAAYLAIVSQLQLWAALRIMRSKEVPLILGLKPFTTAEGRKLLHYCWSTWGTSSIETILRNGDSLAVGGIVTVEAAGFYNIAKRLAAVLGKFNGIFTATVFPEITRIASRRDADHARALKSRAIQATLAIGLLAVLAAALVGGPVIELLFGSRFAPASLPFLVLTAAAAARLVSFTLTMYVQVYLGPRRLLVLFLLAAVIFAVAAVPLTFALSMTGMALGQLLFALALTVLCHFELRKSASFANDSSPSDGSIPLRPDGR